MERTQRNIYPTYWDFHDKLMITPYVPNAASPDTGDLSLAHAQLEKLTPGLEDRPIFAYLKARCSTRQAGLALSKLQQAAASARALLRAKKQPAGCWPWPCLMSHEN